MNTIYQDVSDPDREGFDENDFLSILKYVARFGTEMAKLSILHAMFHESGKGARNPRKAPGGRRTNRKPAR